MNAWNESCAALFMLLPAADWGLDACAKDDHDEAFFTFCSTVCIRINKKIKYLEKHRKKII